MDLLRKVKEDLQKGIEEGLTYVREGASVVMKKAEELTEEGKRRYKLYDLNTKVQHEITELGGRVYELGSKVRNPMLDGKVKAIKARIKKLEAEIMKLEGTPKVRPRKKVAKKRPQTRGAKRISSKN